MVVARRLPLGCAPALIEIASREPLLADLTAAWLAERPHDAAGFPADPGEVVDDLLAAEWLDDEGKPLHAVAYFVGGYHGPITPRGRARADVVGVALRADLWLGYRQRLNERKSSPLAAQVDFVQREAGPAS
jgi:hypothetical protein